MLTPKLDNLLLAELGLSTVVGVDEAGRGAWAGPLALGYFTYTVGDKVIGAVNDSKKLSPKRRGESFLQLQNPNSGVIFRDNNFIDLFGLAQALNSSLLEIFSMFEQDSTLFIVDGSFSVHHPRFCKFVPKADSTYYSVAAASILAKVTRDNIMVESSQDYPGYGFEHHVGYGTKDHRQALNELGVSRIHRKSFRPIMDLL